MAGVKTTPVKKVSCSKSASLCRVCGSQVYVNGGFYSLVAGKLKEANIVQTIAELFGVEDDSVSVWICSDEGLTLETSAFRISVRWPIYIINSVDKTKFLYTTSPPTQHHSFFRNYPFFQCISRTAYFVQEMFQTNLAI